VAGSLQETGGMAEFRLPARLGKVRTFFGAILLIGTSSMPGPKTKDPPARSISGGGSLGCSCSIWLLDSKPQEGAHAGCTTRTVQRALLRIETQPNLSKPRQLGRHLSRLRGGCPHRFAQFLIRSLRWILPHALGLTYLHDTSFVNRQQHGAITDSADGERELLKELTFARGQLSLRFVHT
jgi:hypothetical protein